MNTQRTMHRTRNGIGSCSGVDESIVRGFFIEDENISNSKINQHLRSCHPRGALSMLTSFITCFPMGKTPTHSVAVPSGKAWEKRKAAALLELSKQQQAALADKQDTIDMLEWQLEQLQTATTSVLPAGNTEEDLLSRAQGRCPPLSDISNGCPQETSTSCPPTADKEAGENAALVLLFEMAVVRARLSIRYFCNLFLKQMEASGYPVCRALAELEPGTTFIRKEHAAYILDSRINKAFFHCFESESFDETGITQILDPTKRCSMKLQEYRKMKCLDIGEAVNSKSPWFDSEFLRFCQRKTREMWAEFGFTVVFRSMEERDTFTAAFLDVAKAVWLLHRLAFAVNPSVGILRVGKGMEMNPMYVEAVAVPESVCGKCGKGRLVEFMIMPGFRTQKKVIKCQVYQHVQCKR